MKRRLVPLAIITTTGQEHLTPGRAQQSHTDGGHGRSASTSTTVPDSPAR